MNKNQHQNCRFSEITVNPVSLFNLASCLKSTTGRIMLCVVVAASLSVLAKPALALIDVEAEVGQRSGTWQTSGAASQSISSTTIQMAAHLDPIPLVPVSFGVRVISDSYKTTIADHGIKSLTSTAIVPEITAWLPLGGLKPFARLGYTAVSAYKGTIEILTTNADMAFASTGPRLAVGAEFSLLPLISVTAAIENSNETLKSDTVTGAGFTISPRKTTMNSNAILLGAKVGL